jgi:uncharacterized protein (TIGR03435 family)
MKLFAVALLGLLPIQIPNSSPLRFEVASIKLNNPDGRSGVSGDCHGADSSFASGDPGASIPRGRCVITAARLSHLIGIAYNLPMGRISGGPEFVWGAPRYDILAKAADDSASHAQLIEMLRNLMADRFKLRYHLDAKNVDGHAVVLAKSGPKLKPSKRAEGQVSLKVRGAAINKLDAVNGENTNLNSVVAEGVTIADFIKALAGLPGTGPLVDRTGLTGRYDITLSWEPTESLASVLQEQLGLHLEAEKVPQDFLVIDSAEKPTED